MPIKSILMLAAFAAHAAPSGIGGAQASAARDRTSGNAPASPRADQELVLPGREQDARVARIAYRLATAGLAHCPAPQPSAGLVLQHLSQFRPVDRPSILTLLALDRGPGVIVVVPGGPAVMAGFRAGDVLLSVDGIALRGGGDRLAPFDAVQAHTEADTTIDLLAAARPVTVMVLRDGGERSISLAPLPACPSRVHLARSTQRNAYADGRHVFLTTGLLALLHSDDELAFIIAHEMAHNILGHAAVLRGPAVRSGIGHTLGESGRIVRAAESAADLLGGELMLDAGFDPVAGAGVLTRLGGGELGIALFASHASDAARIAALRTLAERRPAP